MNCEFMYRLCNPMSTYAKTHFISIEKRTYSFNYPLVWYCDRFFPALPAVVITAAAKFPAAVSRQGELPTKAM